MVYMLADSTNKEAVKEFFLKMNRQWEGIWDAAVVMDNHPAHHSHLVEHCLDDIEVRSMFLPPNSSPLNPVERVWATLKHHWTSYLISQEGRVAPENFSARLTKVVNENIRDFTGLYWKSSLNDCSKVLNGILV